MEVNVSEDGDILTGNDRYQGYCADLTRLVAEKLNFSYTIKPVVDKRYGEASKDGKWNGMVGELIRHVSFTDFLLVLNFSYNFAMKSEFFTRKVCQFRSGIGNIFA